MQDEINKISEEIGKTNNNSEYYKIINKLSLNLFTLYELMQQYKEENKVGNIK